MNHIIKGRWIWVDDAQVFRVWFIRDGKLGRCDSVSAFSGDIAAAIRVV